MALPRSGSEFVFVLVVAVSIASNWMFTPDSALAQGTPNEGANGLAAPSHGAAGAAGATSTTDATQVEPSAEAPATGSTDSSAYESILDQPVPPVPDSVPAGYETSGSVPAREAPDANQGQTEIHVPARIATRLRVLDGDLRNLANRGGGSVVDGVLSIVSGGLSITLGVLAPDGDEFLPNYLYLLGAANIARGVVDLSLSPRADDASITFSHMPTGNVEEVRARLVFGEDALRHIAHRARLSRILEASLSIASGAAVVPLYLAPADFKIQSPVDYFVLIGSGVSVVAGIVNLLTRSNAERRLLAYQQLRARLRRERSHASLGWGLAPLRDGGGMFTLQATF